MRRQIHAPDKEQDGIKTSVRNGVQMTVGKLVEPPPGMNHARRKQRFPSPVPPLQIRRLAEIHQVLKPVHAAPHIAPDHDPFRFHIPEETFFLQRLQDNRFPAAFSADRQGKPPC